MTAKAVFEIVNVTSAGEKHTFEGNVRVTLNGSPVSLVDMLSVKVTVKSGDQHGKRIVFSELIALLGGSLPSDVQFPLNQQQAKGYLLQLLVSQKRWKNVSFLVGEWQGKAEQPILVDTPKWEAVAAPVPRAEVKFELV